MTQNRASLALGYTRPATLADLPAIVEIYNEAVLTTIATFDTEPKTVAGRRDWFEEHSLTYPLLVVEVDRVVRGWASLSRWSPRRAYAQTAEISLYVQESYRGRGLGKQLMFDTLAAGQAAGLHTVLARVAGGNAVSVQLHRAAGFELVGIMREVGFKFGRWLDIHLMQKMYHP